MLVGLPICSYKEACFDTVDFLDNAGGVATVMTRSIRYYRTKSRELRVVGPLTWLMPGSWQGLIREQGSGYNADGHI